MEIVSFVSPVSEIVDDDSDERLDSLAEIYLTGGVERDHETDEEDVAVPLIEEEEALDLLSQLRLYEEQQEDGDVELIWHLNKYEKHMEARATEQSKS